MSQDGKLERVCTTQRSGFRPCLHKLRNFNQAGRNILVLLVNEVFCINFTDDVLYVRNQKIVSSSHKWFMQMLALKFAKHSFVFEGHFSLNKFHNLCENVCIVV